MHVNVFSCVLMQKAMNGYRYAQMSTKYLKLKHINSADFPKISITKTFISGFVSLV